MTDSNWFPPPEPSPSAPAAAADPFNQDPAPEGPFTPPPPVPYLPPQSLPASSGPPAAFSRPPMSYGAPIAPRSRARQFFSRYGGAVVAGAMLVGMVVVTQVTGKDEPSPWPEAWDPRVVDIVDFVERERGLEFEHPVFIAFFTEEEYRDLAGASAEPSAATAAYYRDEAALLNAQGLVADGYDALGGQQTFQGELTLGYYSPDIKRMVVIGTELTPATRVVLAHELTHALQDQHFTLDLTDAGFNQRAIVEADAMRVEDAYRATLPADEQAEADVVLMGDEGTAAAADGIPWTVLDRMYAPYALGPALVEQAFADGGNAAVDRLIISPPTEEVLANPWLAGDDGAAVDDDVTVGVEASEGDDLRPVGPLSYLTAVVMLDAWLPWTEARAALEGWEGGSIRAVSTDDGVCVDFGFKVADPYRLVAALNTWAAAVNSAASPLAANGRVTMTACERDGGAAPPTPEITTVGALLLEQYVLEDAEVSIEEFGPAALHCYTGELVDGPAAGLLMTAERTDAQQATLDATKAAAATTCGLPPTFT